MRRPAFVIVSLVLIASSSCSRTPADAARPGSPAAPQQQTAPVPPPSRPGGAPAPAAPAAAAQEPTAPPSAAAAPGFAPAAAGPSAASPSALALLTPAGPPRTDNIAALEMGGRVEPVYPRDVGDFARIKLLDGNPATVWLTSSNLPQNVVVSFVNRDIALVSAVTLSLPRPGPLPISEKPNDTALPKQVEVWASIETPTAGFRQVAVATLPQRGGDHEVAISPPVEARFVKIVIASNYGNPFTTVVSDIAVREGQAPEYVPLLKRHADLAALLSTGEFPATASASTPGLPASPAGSVAATPPITSCEAAAPAAVQPARNESRRVLVVAPEAEVAYAPYDYAKNAPTSPPIKYFADDPGDGRVDSSIFQRVSFWPVTPEAAAPAALVPSAGVDTVVLAQVCQIKTKVSDGFKRALVRWVGAGGKLIIQDADSCGPNQTPDYSFLPFTFATSNPGAQGAPSAMRIVEKNFLVSPVASDPAFIDLVSWTRKINGNRTNDFGDSNTIVKYDPHWCGVMIGSNVSGASGFVLVYAHYGSGLIIYDGVDHDQAGNIAYRQYVARQLLLPFNPDGLTCSTRLSPFVVTTDGSLVSRDVQPGATYTYPISVVPIQPGYRGSVRLSLTPPPSLHGMTARFEPETVTLAAEGKSTLTVTMPATLPEPWRMTLQGTAGDVNATLCLDAHERRTGTLRVAADLGSQPPAQSRKNLLIILDLSGSMNLRLGSSTRIGTARQVLRDVLKRIPDDFNVGLRLYGHRYGSRQKETCTDSELKVPVGPLNRDALLKIVDSTRPRGETPLVYSVLQGLNDLKAVGGGAVALITDGEESCGGDFTSAVNTIRQSGIDFRLSIVGFTLKEQGARQQLGSFAAATGGGYYTAEDGPSLSRALVAATISRFPYRVVSSSGEVVARGEAGDRGQELLAGNYKLVVQAGDDEIVLDRVPVAIAQTATVRVTRNGTRFALER